METLTGLCSDNQYIVGMYALIVVEDQCKTFDQVPTCVTFLGGDTTLPVRGLDYSGRYSTGDALMYYDQLMRNYQPWFAYQGMMELAVPLIFWPALPVIAVSGKYGASLIVHVRKHTTIVNADCKGDFVSGKDGDLAPVTPA